MRATVEPAEQGDAEALELLEQLARTAAREVRGGPALLAEVPPVGSWSGLVGDEARPVWVARLDGIAVGYLAAAVGDGALVVREVFVHPDARRLGLGDELLAAAIDHARQRGFRSVEGTALPGDRLTKNLFERAGVTARKIIVSLDL